MNVLVLGIGNPGRRDDGLGPALVERLANVSSLDPDIALTAEARVQLNIEDADLIRGYDLVVFADATTEGGEPVRIEPLKPSATVAFSTHEMPPAAVLALCEELYDRAPEAWLLLVRGYDWDIGEGLSNEAERNLRGALEALLEFVSDQAEEAEEEAEEE